MKDYQIDIETDERIYTEIVKAKNKKKALKKALNQVPLPDEDAVIRVEIKFISQ